MPARTDPHCFFGTNQIPRPGWDGGNTQNGASSLTVTASLASAVQNGASRKLLLRAIGGLVLTVEAGRHAGARLWRSGDRLAVGSDLANDAVLIADQLAAQHFSVTIADILRGIVEIEAIDDTITLENGRVLRPGQSWKRPMPLRFRAGQAQFRVEPARRVQDVVPGGRKTILAIGAVAALAIGISLLSSISSAISGRSSLAGFGANASLSAGESAVQTARNALMEQIRQAGIPGDIQVEAGPSGTVIATGTVDPAGLEKWRDVLKWYDTRPDSPLLVNNVSRGTANAQTPQFRSVWVDGNPHVVLATGQTARAGDTVPGGWRIETIDRNGVVLVRDGRSMRLTF